MREAAFQLLVASFVELDTAEETERTSSLDRRPGSWVRGLLGLSLSCVGLGYGDGVWAERFLRRVDTRSAEEMVLWDRRSARGWLRRNIASLPGEVRALAQAKGESGQQLDDVSWSQIVSSIDWASASPWGPGDPTTLHRLRRLQCMFVLTRLISVEASPHAAFSFMIGSNRALDGQSPISSVAVYSYRRFEDTLRAAEYYLAVSE